MAGKIAQSLQQVDPHLPQYVVLLDNDTWAPVAASGQGLQIQGTQVVGSTALGNPLYVGGVDGGGLIRGLGLTISHSADRSAVPSIGLYGILVNGFSQILTFDGLTDRQRETAFDNQSAIGIVTSAQQFLYQGFTTDVTTSIGAAAGSLSQFTPRAMSGSINGVSWSIKVGSPVIIDTGSAQESSIVASVTGSTFYAVASNAHSGSGNTALPIVVNTYNQERDATGELDGASGAGTPVALEYEFNGAAVAGGLSGQSSYDRARNLQGKGVATGAITTSAVGSNAFILTASPTGLQPGQWVQLTGGTDEWLLIGKNYQSGNTTVQLAQGMTIQNGAHTNANWSTYARNGPGLNTFLPDGEGTEVAAIVSPAAGSGMYGLMRASDADAMAQANIPAENLVLASTVSSGSFDRARGSASAGLWVQGSASVGFQFFGAPLVIGGVDPTLARIAVVTGSGYLAIDPAGTMRVATTSLIQSAASGAFINIVGSQARTPKIYAFALVAASQTTVAWFASPSTYLSGSINLGANGSLVANNPIGSPVIIGLSAASIGLLLTNSSPIGGYVSWYLD